jgi:hypothetical protein
MTEMDRAGAAIDRSERLGNERFPELLRSIQLQKPCGRRPGPQSTRGRCLSRSPVFPQGYSL